MNKKYIKLGLTLFIALVASQFIFDYSIFAGTIYCFIVIVGAFAFGAKK